MGSIINSASIAIVAYKNYPDVLNALQSLLKYTPESAIDRLYVIDNSALSENDSKKLSFKNELLKLPFIEYIDTRSNLGFAAGHNFILKRLKSKLHIIMNPDVFFLEDSVSKIIEFMNQTNVGMCVPRILDEQGTLQRAYRREITIFDILVRMFNNKLFKKRYAYHTMQDKNFSETFRVPFAHGAFFAIRTGLFKMLNGFDERFFMYMEDADLCKRVNCVSEVVYFPKTAVIHRWERGSHKSGSLFRIHINSMILYFKKWGVRFV